MKVLNLKTDYKVNPIGIGNTEPCLSWEIASEKTGVLQTAYHIRAALNESDLNSDKNLIWDTQKVLSNQSINVEYKGSKLFSGQRVFWNVKVWDNKGNESGWSEIAFWEMGLLQVSDWKAFWIEPDINEDTSVSTPAQYLRKEFQASKPIKSAQLYITCHGLFLLYLNGKNANDELFSPGWTSYHKRLQYRVYDVTNNLEEGKNAVGVILGDGWYRGYLTWQGGKNLYGDKLALLFQLKITYNDGTEEFIISDETWKASTGPILSSDIYNGETYDARLEQTEWSNKGFKADNWKGVIKKNYNNDNLIPSEGVPVRITQTIKPVGKKITPNGELVFDLGQNIVGWAQITASAPKGTKITLNFAEVLDKDGNFYTANLRKARNEDIYIFKGEGDETYEPHFTFHGFRYIKISDFPGEISIDNIRGRVIHSDMAPIGEFECSDPLLNRLQQNIQWGLRGNFLDVPTDCPQRDERLGWTGDAQVFAPTACFNMDASSFFRKWMNDLAADQKKNGSVPWVVPMVIEGGGGTGWSDGYGATGWADAAVVIPWTVYQAYGDKFILEKQYPSMKAWVEYMKNEAGDSYIFNTVFHFGDWLSFGEYYSYYFNAPDYGYAGAHTDKDLIATAYFFYSAGLLEKAAMVLNKKSDAAELRKLQIRIKKAFQKEFVTSTGRLTSNTQTAYSIALIFGIMPDDMKKSAAKRLAEDVTHFGHLTTGFLGTPVICQALSDYGYPDLAYKLLFNKKYPSWLYPVTMGATTIWERWDGIKPDGTFQDPGMNSFNHYAYGAVGNFLYSRVAGLSTDPDYPGYKKFVVNPCISKELNFALVKYHSVYGLINAGWRIEDGRLKIIVTVPTNSSAKVHFPTLRKENILKNNTPVFQNKEFKFIEMKNNRVVFEIGSGEYIFEVTDWVV